MIAPIGQKIKELRARLGLGTREFARKLNVSPAAVSKWESGEREPQPSMLAAIWMMLRELERKDPDEGYFLRMSKLDRRRIEKAIRGAPLNKEKPSDLDKHLVRLPILSDVAHFVDPQAAPASSRTGVIGFPEWMIREPEKSFLYEVQDDMMLPLLRRGDLVLIERAESPDESELRQKLIAVIGKDRKLKIRFFGKVGKLLFCEASSGAAREPIGPETENEIAGFVMMWICGNLS
jgi:transcriptional regulator with XRE-family HTH domain